VPRRIVVRRARRRCQFAKSAPRAVPRHLIQSLRFGTSERTARMRRWSMTQLQTCQMSRATNQSVRQCARRLDHRVAVAQASPLFSDHAPREVHLWQ